MKMIYHLTFGEYKERGWAKIGETKDLKKRMSSLRSAIPDDPDVYTANVNDNISDKQFHRFLKDKKHIKHIKNEWFECTLEQFYEAIKEFKQIYADNTPLEKAIELQLHKNKIKERGQSATVARINKILKFSGILDDYDSLLGKLLKCQLTNGKSIIFSINKGRAYCGPQKNKEYFPKDRDLLYVTSANIIIKSESLF